jgi:hypothetical protein
MLAVASLANVLLTGAVAHAQMQRSVLESLPVSSPPHPANLVRNVTGGIFVDTISNYAVNAANQNADDPQNVAYVQISGPAGSLLYVSPFFSDPIPAPTATTDACHHAHLEWAMYAFGIRTLNFGSFTIPLVQSVLVGSNGELGRRVDANGNQVPDLTPGASCAVTSAPDQIYTSFNGVFDWGGTYGEWNMGPIGDFNTLTLMVPSQAVSHGWGSCGRFLCFQNVGFVSARFR